MDRISQPSKEHVREWLRERQEEHTPPPDAAQIRRELGWRLVEGAYEAGGAAQQMHRIDKAMVSVNGTRT